MRSRDEMAHRFNEVRAGLEPGLEVDLGEPVVGYNAVENAPEHRVERKSGGWQEVGEPVPERERRGDEIGEILISENKITGVQHEQALELQKRDQ